ARYPHDVGVFRKLVLDITAPLDRAVHLPLHSLREIWEKYLFLIGLGEENRRLKGQNAELTQLLTQYKEVHQENQRLRKLLSLRESLKYQTITARVIGNDRKSALKTILIDRGESHGVKRSYPVINERGVVGRVIETSWHVSRILLVTDANSNVDCFFEDTRVQGILHGSGSDFCTVKYVAKTEDIKVGEKVLTAGFSGIFPKGHLLGTVRKTDRKESGLFQRIEVSPAVDFTRLEEVLVVGFDK
ncbi:MAG: rod shape-determining protein MreC, partial [Syntrophales bacterium]|nr:rod shape-determining protein MreC [Syntrophales bacterium]